MKACRYCAEEIADAAIKCKHCGEFLIRNDSGGGSKKSRIVALILLVLFGTLGVHAFYAQRPAQGVIFLVGAIFGSVMWQFPAPLNVVGPVVFLCLGVFLISDFIRLLTGHYSDGQSEKITSWT